MTPGTTNANVGHRIPAKMHMRLDSHMGQRRSSSAANATCMRHMPHVAPAFTSLQL